MAILAVYSRRCVAAKVMVWAKVLATCSVINILLFHGILIKYDPNFVINGLL